MDLEIDANKITMLSTLKGKALLSSLGQLFVVKDFTIKEEVKKGILGRERRTNYLKEIKIFTYHQQGKFLGTLREDACESMLHRYDFYVMRQQWIDFCDQLKAFGFKVEKIEAEVTA